MSRKDFKLIAEVLKEQKPAKSWENKYVQWKLIVKNMTEALKTTNPRFDAQRFLSACAFEE